MRMVNIVGAIVIALLTVPSYAEGDGNYMKIFDSKGGHGAGYGNLLMNSIQVVSFPGQASLNAPAEHNLISLISSREFKISGHGSLVLDVPRSWIQSVNHPPNGLPPTIVLRPMIGDEFQLLVTPLWSPNGDPKFNSPQKVKEAVGFAAKAMTPLAAEKTLIVEEIPRDQGSAFYVFATDKDPKPGDYPYAIQGGIGFDDLLVTITFLFRNKDSEFVDTILNLFSTARKK